MVYVFIVFMGVLVAVGTTAAMLWIDGLHGRRHREEVVFIGLISVISGLVWPITLIAACMTAIGYGLVRLVERVMLHLERIGFWP